MAKITIKTADEYSVKLSKLEANHKEIAGKAIYAGAKVVADQIKANLGGIPEDTFRFLRDGDKLNSTTSTDKKELIDSFGVSTMEIDGAGDYNVKCGFSGYLDTPPTVKYPTGLPAQLVARAIESGSSVRQSHPFVRPAVSKTKNKAKNEMARVIDEEMKKIMGGN